ncbi:MAG: tetratricopeptide repeat protein [Cyanobacteria bacterium SIG29]|nr:tetratricopeptide repeat protein [Cyanobacteria bacterium SIG29]
MTYNYNQLFNRAYNFHKNNHIKEAQTIYEGLLEINPDDVNVLNLYALLCMGNGNASKAVDLLSKAVILNGSALLYTNLAKAYYMNGEPDKSVIFYQKAFELEPSEDILYSMGISYKYLKKYNKAIDSYKRALKINPNNYNVLYNLTILYRDTDQLKKAIKIAEKAEFINPNDEDIHSLLSGLYEADNDYKKSIRQLQKAFSLNPQQYLYAYNQGVLYSKIGENEKAIECYKNVLVINPNHIETLVNIANLYKNDNKDEALKYLEKAFSLDSQEENVCLALAQEYKDLYCNEKSMQILSKLNSPESNFLMAINLMDLQRYNEALDYYQKACDMDNQNPNYLHGLAVAYKYLGDMKNAKRILSSIKDKSIQTTTTLGMLYLQEKDFYKGMELYIQRSEDSKFKSLFNSKIWTKDCSLNNKIVLVYTDCGLGDTIMFARYLPLLEKVANKVILQTDKELVKILKDNFPNIEVVSKTSKIDEYDIVIPIMNLAYALDIDFDNIPFPSSYLKSDIKELKSDKLKVGIFYQGNKRVFKNRSIPYSEIIKLTNDNVELFSFQLSDFQDEGSDIINLKDKINDYSDTAKFLKSLDVLITIDSSIAHMAGALGVKTFLLLPYIAEWRWFNDDFSTPWYDSVRIFKQTSNLSWNDVIEKVKNELNNFK